MTDDVMVYMRHIRAAHQCSRGGRNWFKSHGLNWSKFLSDGIPSSVLGQWNDPLADATIAEAQREASEKNDGR